jgi:hypothetical protein
MIEKSLPWKSAPAVLERALAQSSAKSISSNHWGIKMNRKLRLEITLGDLVYALTEEVRRHIRDENLVYEIVADLLAGMTSARGKINYSGIPSQLARLAS